MKLRVKDEEGEEHIVECDDYGYLVDEKSLHAYRKNGDNRELIAAYNNIKWFKEDDSDKGKKETE